ncbi:MAG: carboxypeptidase Taq [Paracoccaceae bacterium]|jgi:carboxypeptidase Taq
MTNAYYELLKIDKTNRGLASISERSSWDQETMMPGGAASQRSEETAALQEVLHERRINPKIGDLLEKAVAGDIKEKAKLKIIKREYERYKLIPTDLATEIARVTSKANWVWAEARSEDNFSKFAPILKKVVNLKKQEAAALSNDGELYNALLSSYEWGLKSSDLEVKFNSMRKRLVSLRNKISGSSVPQVKLNFEFDEGKQMKVANLIAKKLQFDFYKGRIDKSVHPFSSGSGSDVRITTRTNVRDPFNCFYSTIHEIGHAMYEQNISQEYFLSALGNGVSLGIHESQSRIYENQIGRSKGFTSWLFNVMRQEFGDFGVGDEDQFYRLVNSVSQGFIRTEADEVNYNLHIMLRFDLERSIISGDLEVDDLEEAWNQRFYQDFNVKVAKSSNGVLQDVHWSYGEFGYFPTYTLGNVYAGCLYEKLRESKKIESELAIGNALSATQWLRDNVQVHGSLYEAEELIEKTCGKSPTEEPLLTYLEAKYKDLYNL